MANKTLSGACFCGRNRYTFTIQDFPDPPEYGPPPHVFYDNCADCRRAQAAPIVVWMRLPKAWVTFTQHPKSSSESVSEIFKTNASSAGIERKFCGFCGTQLSWHAGEKDPKEANWIDITVGSIVDEDLARLEELKLVPGMHFYWNTGLKWFQRAFKGSHLGEFPKVKETKVADMVDETKEDAFA